MTTCVEWVVSVAIPRPLDGLFTYRLPLSLLNRIQMGGVVKVPFGRVSTHAFIVEMPKPLADLPSGFKIESLKEIVDVIDDVPPLPPDVLSLCRWTSDFYFSPLGEVLTCATPILSAQIRKLKRRSKKIINLEMKQRQLSLTPAQCEVVEKFDLIRRTEGGKVALLQGVTGSGKTEVYIEIAKRTLLEGRGVIVLVPEIALTPQLHQRIEAGLGVPVGLWHSALSSGKRRDLYEALIAGQIRVIVGARSAVFAPVSALGLIIVDEEHDATYKQEDRARYHARDLAVVRAKMTQSFVVLGSATPSLESLERVREGRYSLGRLDQRVTPGGLPEIQLIDLKEGDRVVDTQASLDQRTLHAMQETINAGEQVIVYLNRRGFAAFLLCKDCGEVTGCPRCSISLTVHRFKPEMKCHHCGHREMIPLTCSKCQGMNLKAMGAGTESLESDLGKLLTDARITRLDRDLITSATRLNKILDGFRLGESNLLLGTQMLVKGHDFPNVTLVVVILADALFRWPDFRAPERALQVLKQVSGRAGRGDKPGRVLIQTYDKDHPVLQVVEGRLSEETFIESERELRKALCYPPFGRIARIRFEGAIQKEVFDTAQEIVKGLNAEVVASVGKENRLDILGPSEAFLERVNDVFRWDVLLKANAIQVLQKAIRYCKSSGQFKKKRFQIDVDPYGV